MENELLDKIEKLELEIADIREWICERLDRVQYNMSQTRKEIEKKFFESKDLYKTPSGV